MDKIIKILMLEDSSTDAELIQYELKKTFSQFEVKIVETEEDFTENLNQFSPDLVLSDYSLPSFDGISAYLIVKNKIYPHRFIVDINYKKKLMKMD